MIYKYSNLFNLVKKELLNKIINEDLIKSQNISIEKKFKRLIVYSQSHRFILDENNTVIILTVYFPNGEIILPISKMSDFNKFIETNWSK